jgi:CRISPR-associated protein Cas2
MTLTLIRHFSGNRSIVMLVLITYDVNTQTAEGQRRLRHIAKICTNYGQRVQNSVFECKLDAAQYKKVAHDLKHIIDPQMDSLRFYNLGNQYRSRIEHIGIKPAYDVDEAFIL